MLTIYLVVVCFVATAFSIRRLSDRRTFVAVLVLLAFFLTIYFLQIGRIDTHGSLYFELIAADGLRYLGEANAFEKPWRIDEINGSYQDADYFYKATPKFGLSAFVSVLSPFFDASVEYAYFLMLAGSLLLNALKIKLIGELEITDFQKIVVIALVVFFPLDLYWSLRFLRELIANDILELFCIYAIVRKENANPLFLSGFILALLIWRSQLTLFIIPIMFLVFKPRIPALGFMGLILVATFSQIIKASGVSGLLFIGLPQPLVDLIFLFGSPEASWFFIVAIVLAPLLFPRFAPRTFNNASRLPLYGFLGFLPIFVIAFLLFHQIRFWYPIFEVTKFFAVTFLALAFRFRFGRVLL